MWGGGGRGRLGHKDDDPESQPRVVESLLGHNIAMIACGGAHTLALSGKSHITRRMVVISYRKRRDFFMGFWFQWLSWSREPSRQIFSTYDRCSSERYSSYICCLP